MKKITTNNIAPGKGQPFGKRSLEHLQAGFKEVIAATLEAVNNGRKQVVYLSGCTVASAASQHHNAAGWAYSNGEVFEVPEGVVNSPGLPVWVVDESFENGGAVPFSNLEFHDILAVRRLKLAAPGTPGGIELANADTYANLLSTMHTHSDLDGLEEALDSKADKNQPEPTEMALDGGVNYVNFPPLTYLKDTIGFVHLNGIRVVRYTEFAANMMQVTIATLPEGSRPIAKQTHYVLNGVGKLCSFIIETDGRIVVTQGYDSYQAQEDCHITFSSVTFKAA